MLDILYEDSFVLAVNKEALIHSVSNFNEEEVSIAKLIKDYLPKNSFIQHDKDNGLVQRLDFSSSGVLIAAKNKDSFLKLKEEIKLQRLYKSYLIIVENKFLEKSITLNNFIGQEYRRSKKVKVYKHHKPRSLEAKTDFYLKATNGKFSLMKALVAKGRRHQIRVHASSIGHPLVGDTMYGAKSEFEKLFNIKRNFFLHSLLVKFKHPIDNEIIEIKANLSNTEEKLIKEIFGEQDYE